MCNARYLSGKSNTDRATRQPVDAHGVENYCVVGGQHATDGQAVVVVSIGHGRAGYGHGQLHGNFHLVDGTLLDVFGPEHDVFLALDQADVPVGRRQQGRLIAPVGVSEVEVGVGE